MPRGGKRPGSGRPVQATKRVTGSITLSAQDWAALDSLAVASRLRGRGEAVQMLLQAKRGG